MSTGTGLKVIVVGFGELPGAQAALQWAADLARATGAALVAVHVFEPLDHLDEVHPGIDLRAVREKVGRRLEENVLRPLSRSGLEITPLVLEGEPADVLLDVARERSADLLVVGMRRLGWLEGMVLGSTSRKVSQSGAFPVAIVPERPLRASDKR
jgi:nucleotide-binding universal stress UspA family protein